jgi:serine/threonine-protein kinase
MSAADQFPRCFGKYRLLEKLAEGGMGAVYLASSGARGMEKVCALKVVLPNLASPEYVARFLDEAKVMVRLTHGSLVQVFDAGEIDDEAYIAMEFVEGQDLRAIWNRCVEVQRAFPVDVAVHLLKEACRGLAYAHSYEGLQLVHRDISPPNIMATYAGESKVMDFGLAHSALKLEHTSPGLVYGKVPYMAPEQARGEHLDGRADVYAVGVVLWELLTGRRLFPSKGDQAAEIAERARGPQAPSTREFTRRVPPGLDEILQQALAPDPKDRFASAEEMATTLGRFLSTNWPGTDTHRVGAFMLDLFAADRAAHRQKVEKLLAAAAELDPAAASPVTPPPASDANLLGGRYRLGARLGIGGMGEVFEAEHETIGKRVAVKILHKGFGRSADVVARFKREARVASRIEHPGIVDVTDFGQAEDGRLFFVMELLEGRLLSDLLGRGQPLPLRQAADIGLQLASALTAAHEAGLLHRDLKPENVMLVPDGRGHERVKVLDFGIAKELAPGGTSEMLTRPGTTLGTPEYMSPEQAAGQPADARSDVYAFGVLLYEMLTGGPPHSGATAKEVLYRKLRDPVVPLAQKRPETPADLSAVVMRCLEASPEARPSGLREVALTLQTVRAALAPAGDEPEPELYPVTTGRLPAWRRREGAHTEIIEHGEPRRRPWGKITAAVAVAAAAVVAAVLLWPRPSAAPERPGRAATPDAGAALALAPRPDAAVPPQVARDAALAPAEARTGPAGPADRGARRVAPPPEDPRRPGEDPGVRTVAARDRGQALIAQARQHLAAGLYAAARSTLLQAAEIPATRTVALAELARAAFERQDFGEAVAVARRAVQSGAGVPTRMILGNGLFRLGRYAEAAAAYRQVLARQPGHATATRMLAQATERAGQ